jgi:hypothetical protein
MFQLRIYTLRSAAALDRYATVHWARHIPSLAAFGVTTCGIWTQRGDGSPRLVALVSYPDGADPEALERDFMASAEFASDMDGFIRTTSLPSTPRCSIRRRRRRFGDGVSLAECCCRSPNR